MPIKINQRIRVDNLVVHVDAPRMRRNVNRTKKLPIVRMAKPNGETIGWAHGVIIEGIYSLITSRIPIPKYPTAICVLRISAPVRRVK